MKKLFIIMSISFLVLGLVSFRSSGIEAFSSGSGTCDNPYVIMTSADLVEMHNDLTLCYVLGQSIDMDGVEWIPLGTYYDPFIGVLDGAGFSISNLSATTVEIDYDFGIAYTMAMFGVVAGEAEIFNLGLNIDYIYDSNLDGENIMVGGLTALVESSDVTIQDIWVSGSIDVTTSGGDEFVSIGGLIGEAYSLFDLTGLSFTGTITSAVDIVDYLSVGGLIGSAIDISIRNSKIFDVIINTSQNIDSGSYVGGLVGELDLYNPYFIDENVATFEKNVVDHLTINDLTGAEIGGLAGYVYNGNNDYVWIDENLVTNTVLGEGSGISGGLVGDAENMGFRQNQLSSVTIGSDTDTGDLGGLVGYSYECSAEDNYITGLSIIGGDYSNAIGGIAGYAEYSVFKRNFVSGSLISKGDYVGGIAGHVFGLEIGDSAFEGTLEGLENVGGLVGYSEGSEGELLDIYSSWSKGSITATTEGINSNVGGLVGFAIQCQLDIQDSYSLADVEGEDVVGGLVGSNAYSYTRILRSYFGGTVTGTTNVDALIGLNTESDLWVESLFFDEAGGTSTWGEGASTADLKDASSDAGLGLDASEKTIDYDLDSEWFVNENVNDGYLDVKANRAVLRFVDQSEEVEVQLSWGKIVTYATTSNNPNITVLPNWKILAVEPTDPTRSGYVFEGWYFDLGGSNEDLWNFEQDTYVNDTITAKWTVAAEVLNVTYNGNGSTSGTVPTDVTDYDSEDTVTVLGNSGNLAKTGYTFDGWTYDSITYKASDTFSISEDTTLSAKWTVAKYVVVFEDYDKTNLSSQTINHGSAATAPNHPTRIGYHFKGWDESFGEITKELTVTAIYEKITELITDVSNGLDTKAKDLAEAVEFTADELDPLHTLSLRLELTIEALDALSSADKALVESYQSTLLEDGLYTSFFVDINLFKIIDEASSKVYTTDAPITITFKISESLYTKEFKLIRLHTNSEGVTRLTELEYTYNSETHEITFKTNEFSVFGLVSATTKLPYTGAKSNSGVLLLMISILLAFLSSKRKQTIE